MTAELQGPYWFRHSAEALGIPVFHRITAVRLGGPGVTDELMDPISRLHYLNSALLRSPHVTDAGLMRLARLPNLRALTLYGEQISDETLRGLATFARLERLTLSHTQATSAGVAALQRRRPDLEIMRTGPSWQHLR